MSTRRKKSPPRGQHKDETAYLLESPANAARLAEAVAEIEAGRARHRWPGGRGKRHAAADSHAKVRKS